MTFAQRNDHYSYRVYADPQVARTFDADRFGGEIGGYIKDAQQCAVRSRLGDVQGWKIVDVGAGTGRFAIHFHEVGAEVIASDASFQMLQVLQLKTSERSMKLPATVGDAHNLQFPDRTFNCAVSFRMLMHVINWRRALSELCRVSSDWVVFDVAPRRGFLLLVPFFHFLGKLLRIQFQPYRTIRTRQISKELERNNFRIVAVDPGFFLPLAVHRLISSLPFTTTTERIFSQLGLTRRIGAPLTIFARRQK